MILLETPTSIFEVIWDVVLALFIVRIAFVYFLLTLLSGCAIAYFRILTLQPVFLLTQPQPEFVSLPVWLMFIVLWARYITQDYEVPRVAGFRLVIGFVALIFMVISELIGGFILYEWGYIPWIWETDVKVVGAGAVVLLLFALMPFLFMSIERRPVEPIETSHGHEKKQIIAAL